MVALLWGSNIGGAFPVLAVIAQNKSLQQWIDGEIESSQTNIQKLETESKELQAQLAGVPPANIDDLQSQLRTNGHSLEAEQKHLGRFQRLKPYVDAYLPHDPYKTVVLVLMIISIGYILKNFFLVLDSILVDRLSNLATLDLRKKFYRRTLRMDMTSFGKARVSELMARFTGDVDAINGGIQTVIGRAVREPLSCASTRTARSSFAKR